MEGVRGLGVESCSSMEKSLRGETGLALLHLVAVSILVWQVGTGDTGGESRGRAGSELGNS